MTPEQLYRKTYEIVGWAYEGDIHCPCCAAKRFGERLKDEEHPPEDREGNPISPVFLGETMGDEVCDDCLAELTDE